MFAAMVEPTPIQVDETEEFDFADLEDESDPTEEFDDIELELIDIETIDDES